MSIFFFRFTANNTHAHPPVCIGLLKAGAGVSQGVPPKIKSIVAVHILCAITGLMQGLYDDLLRVTRL